MSLNCTSADVAKKGFWFLHRSYAHRIEKQSFLIALLIQPGASCSKHR